MDKFPGPRWTKADYDNFYRVRSERLPAVVQASRGLQSAMGITPGMRMVGKAPVLLWEMPEPPKQTITEMFESLGARIGRLNKVPSPVAAIKAEEVKEDDEDGEVSTSDESEGADELLWFPPADQEVDIDDSEEEMLDATKRDDNTHEKKADIDSNIQREDHFLPKPQDDQSRPLKRKRQISLPDQAHHNDIEAKKPKIIIDLTDDPHKTSVPVTQSQTQQPLLQPGHEKQTAAITSTLQPASPPPNWVPSYRAPYSKHLPGYWSHNLSKNLNRWLEEAGTQSSQILLSHLELRSFSQSRGPNTIATMNARDYAKMKLSRVTLPPFAGQSHAHASPLPLEWVVIQINFKTPAHASGNSSDDDDDDEQIIPLPRGALPYWLIAFPRQAITKSKKDYQQIVPSPSPPRPQGRRMAKKAKLDGVHITTLLLGEGGRAPLVHGRGVKARFAQGFVEACAAGEGVVELRSSDAVAGFDCV